MNKNFILFLENIPWDYIYQVAWEIDEFMYIYKS